MRNKVLYGVCLCTLVICSACDNWGTVVEARDIFENDKATFLSIYESLEKHPKLHLITPDFTPTAENMSANPQFGELSIDDKRAYMDIVEAIEKSDIKSISVYKIKNIYSKKITKTYEFYIFTRGFGGSTEGIEVLHKVGDLGIEKLVPPPSSCEPLSVSEWYVCYRK